jgi:hypothetical protein
MNDAMLRNRELWSGNSERFGGLADAGLRQEYYRAIAAFSSTHGLNRADVNPSMGQFRQRLRHRARIILAIQEKRRLH